MMAPLRVLVAVSIGAIALGALGMSACSTVEDCDLEFVYGLTVDVSDGVLPICDATVTIVDADHTEVLEAFSCGTYVGAGERAGTYAVTVAAPGFATDSIDGVSITDGRCHVNARVLDVELVAD